MSDWALILGASSGFGEATARKLAEQGLNIAGVHLDSREEKSRVNRLKNDLKNRGSEVVFHNCNAADEENKDEVLADLDQRMEGSSLRLLFHSLSFGSIAPYIPSPGDGEDTRSWLDRTLDFLFWNEVELETRDTITKDQLEMTLDVMAHTLVYWTQGVFERGLFAENSRVLAMTSAGGHTAWPNYGAVAAAKGALEAHIRQLASELGEYGITANALQAGVTDTPSLREIPGHEYKLKQVAEANPMDRTTRTDDVAKVVSTFIRSEMDFVNGEIIRVDGGEDIV